MCLYESACMCIIVVVCIVVVSFAHDMIMHAWFLAGLEAHHLHAYYEYWCNL